MRSTHHKSVKAWLNQARDDLDTAVYLIEGERFSYGAYLAHLALEKALKGLYLHRFGEAPPVTHSLVYLAERANLVIPDDLCSFLEDINEASILNFYPDHLLHDQKQFDGAEAERFVEKSRIVFDWITDHVPADHHP